MFREPIVIKTNSGRHHSSWFKIFDDHAYMVEQGELSLLRSGKELVKTYQDMDLSLVTSRDNLVVGNSIIGYDLVKRNQLVAHATDLVNFKLPFDSKSNKIYAFQRDKKLKIHQSGLFDTDINAFSLVKDVILNINYIQDDIYLTADHVRIDDAGNDLWKLDLTEFQNPEIKEIIGVWNGELIVACSDHLLIAIDVHTGKVIRSWRELKGFEAGQFYKDVLPEPRNFVLDKASGKLIGVFDTYYFEIDLVSGGMSFLDVADELSRHGITDFRPFANNAFTGDQLYVTAHARVPQELDVDFSSVLALNRSTGKVDWVYIFRDAGLGTNVPQITSTHLFQLDTDNNIYIFAKM